MIAVMENDWQSSKGKARRAAGNGLRAVCASAAVPSRREMNAGDWVGKYAARVVDKAKALGQMQAGSGDPLASLDSQSEHTTERRNRMRVLTLLALIFALPAMAQPYKDMPQIEGLAARLNAPQMAADKPAGGPQNKPMALMDPGVATAAKAGWNSYSMGVCIAGIYQGNEFIAALATTGEAMITQSTYALGVVAANCASGKTFWVYLEADLSTVSAIGSYPR